MCYLCLCCLFVMVCGWQPFFRSLMRRPRRCVSLPCSFYVDDFAERQCISLSWLLCACVLLATALLSGLHTFLVLTNQTTIELHTNMRERHAAKRAGEVWRNPYDLGRRRNFQEVFGPSAVWSMLW